MSQTEEVYALLRDGLPHSTVEIMERCYGGDHLGLARVGARIWDVKHKHGVTIKSWRDKEKRSIHWYQIVSASPEGSSATTKEESVRCQPSAVVSPRERAGAVQAQLITIGGVHE